MTDNTHPLESVLLAVADDELVIGHRHSEWTGWAPHIEEDIAFSSIAQDEIGHANVMYQLLSELDGRSPDQLALGREPGEYRHAQICEQPNRDWAYTLARHFLYEIAERVRLESFRESTHKPLADVAMKLLNEERYHEMHADAWFKRLVHGPVEGRHQMEAALAEAFPQASGIFEAYSDEDAALAAGVLKSSSRDLHSRWLSEVMDRVEEAGIQLSPHSHPDDLLPTSSGALLDGPEHAEEPGAKQLRGGRLGARSEHFQELWDDLTKTYREEPAATW